MYITLLLCVPVAIYFYLKYVYSHWERNAIPFLEPSIPFGNLGDVAKQKSAFGIHIYNLYKQSKEYPLLAGIYLFFRPAILLRDADLIKRVLTTDFNSFHDRGTFHNPDLDPLSSHLFNMPGAAWKNLRAKLTPAFTTGKLKSMMPTILVEGENLKKYMQKIADNEEVIPMKRLIDRFVFVLKGY